MPNLKHKCRSCDKDITAGEYCKDCLAGLRKDVLAKKMEFAEKEKVEKEKTNQEQFGYLYRSRDLLE
jgi:hypothetical protein